MKQVTLHVLALAIMWPAHVAAFEAGLGCNASPSAARDGG